MSFIAPAAYASGHNGEYPIAELTLGNSFGMKNIQRIGWGDVGDYGTRLVRDGRECLKLNKEGSKTLFVYTVTDIDGNAVETGELKKSVKGKEKTDEKLTIKTSRNGVYVLTLKVTTTGPNGMPVTYEEQQDFSIMDKFK